MKEQLGDKNRFKGKVREFALDYNQRSARNSENNDEISWHNKDTGGSWHQNFTSDEALNSMLETGCLQLLNEKLNAYATGRFQRPQHAVSSSKSSQINIFP
jgi:hypothetical protein